MAQGARTSLAVMLHYFSLTILTSAADGLIFCDIVNIWRAHFFLKTPTGKHYHPSYKSKYCGCWWLGDQVVVSAVSETDHVCNDCVVPSYCFVTCTKGNLYSTEPIETHFTDIGIRFMSQKYANGNTRYKMSAIFFIPQYVEHIGIGNSVKHTKWSFFTVMKNDMLIIPICTG